MMEALRARPWQRAGFRRALWLVALTVWTFLLITPGTWYGDSSRTKVAGLSAGKLLHVSAYASLAAVVGWISTARLARAAFLVSLIVHGSITELIQAQTSTRDGNWRDVAIDAGGVILGWTLSRWWWPAPPAGG